MLAYQSFNGLQTTQINSETEAHLETLQRKGFFVIEQLLSATELAIIRQKMDAIWQQQLAEFGEELLHKIGDYGQVRCMMHYDPYFFDLIIHPEIFKYVSLTVGETAILHTQNGIVLHSGQAHNQAKYHKDFPKNFLSSEILSFNAFIAIDDFTAATGGTWFVPHSHHQPNMPSPQYIEQNQVQIIAPAGSVVFFDSTVWHRAGHNTSGRVRRAINQIYTRPFIKQQIDYPALFKGRVDMESKIAQTLGMWTVPPKNLQEFRVDHPSKRTYRGGQG